MTKKSSFASDAFGNFLGGLIGWAFSLGFLAVAFAGGRWAASAVGWDIDGDVAGLLSALAFIWFYERTEARGRHDRLFERIGQVAARDIQ